MARCQAFTSKQGRWKDTHYFQCQSDASIIVHGVGLCGTHLNKGFRERLNVVTEMPLLKDEDL